MGSNSRQPILVTGLPRSGTTWLARLLAAAPGTVMLGREPMNPRGRQYGLGGTVEDWTRLRSVTDRQAVLLRRVYRGRSPLSYGRYGRRQWMGAWPSARIVVKDPFAMLSIPAVSRAAGARPLLVFRSPGAVLASYRRMGWTPDLDAVSPIVDAFLAERPDSPRGIRPLSSADPTSPEAMGWFWSVMYGMALADTSDVSSLVVSHEELAVGGIPATQALFDALGLRWTDRVESELRSMQQSVRSRSGGLHDFRRDPRQVANAWREELSEGERECLDTLTAAIRDALERRRLSLAVT